MSPILPPDQPQQEHMNTLMSIGTWLVSSFGPTETILITIAGIMMGVVMGWMPSPMMSTMQAIREDQIRRTSDIEMMKEMHKSQTTLLRIICVHDSSNDEQKAECWK